MRKRRSTRTPTPTSVSVPESELGGFAKMAKAAWSNTTREACVERFGAGAVKDLPDGSWECRVNGSNNVSALREMDRPRQRVEVEMASERQARTPMVTMTNSDGFTAQIPAAMADEVAERAESNGLQVKERRHYGRPTLRYLGNGQWVRLR